MTLANLYKNEEKEKLKNRSAAGKKHKGEQKLEILFEKKNTMEKMLNSRLNYELQNISSSSEFSKRLNRLNQLIRGPIHNILKTTQSRSLGKPSTATRDEEELPALKRAKHDAGKIIEDSFHSKFNVQLNSPFKLL